MVPPRSARRAVVRTLSDAALESFVSDARDGRGFFADVSAQARHRWVLSGILERQIRAGVVAGQLTLDDAA